MKRLKMFFKYALCIAIFWFLSDFLIYMGINGTYKTIEAKGMTESLTINVAEAKATLIENQTAFYRRDYIGHKLRECAINIWKDKLVSDGKRSKSELDDETAAMIIADLENDVDIKNAMVMNIEDA